jgi:hypothetical protein
VFEADLSRHYSDSVQSLGSILATSAAMKLRITRAKDPTIMRSMMMVGIAAAALTLGGVTVQQAKAATATAPVAPRATPAPAPKPPVLTNQQLTPRQQPATNMPTNHPGPTEPSLANKIVNGPSPTLKDFKGSNAPPRHCPRLG